MKVGKIKNSTRTIGESQGYIGLPLRESYQPNAISIMPGISLPGKVLESLWEFSTEDVLAIYGGAPLILTVIGDGHPPVILRVDMTERVEDEPRVSEFGWVAFHEPTGEYHWGETKSEVDLGPGTEGVRPATALEKWMLNCMGNSTEKLSQELQATGATDA